MAKRTKESFLTRFVNFLTVIFLAAIMLFGIQGYQNSTNHIRFAQVSDAHFSTLKINTSYRLTAESGALLEDVITQINSMLGLDFVMFTGDMINKPYEKELNAFLPYADKLNYKWYAAFGNHDICVGGYLTKSLYLSILQKNNANFKFTNSYYSFIPKKGYKVIVLDSVIDDRITSNGHIDAEQLNWLDKELSKSKNDVVLIFMHHPLKEPLPSPSHRITNADEVYIVLQKYKMPIGVFTGHYHTTKIIPDGNIINVSTPSLVSYPNAFRVVTVTIGRKNVTFDVQIKETNLKDIQKRAKLMTFNAGTYLGEEKDKNIIYKIEKR